MDRRKFLKSTTGVASLAATAQALPVRSAWAGAAPSRIGRHIQLRVGLDGPNNGQGVSDTFGQFAAQLHTLTDGAVTFVVAGEETDGLRRCQSGDLDLMVTSAHNLVNETPEFAYFAGLPGRLNVSGPEIRRWVSGRDGHALWTRLAADFNLKPVLVDDGGPQSLLFSKTKLDASTTFAKKSIVTHGLACEVIAGLGGVCQPRSSRRLIGQSLKRGGVDLVEAAGMPDALANGLLQPGVVASTPGIYRHAGPVTCAFNRSLWQCLPTDVRGAIETAAATTFDDSVQLMRSQHDMMRGAAHLKHKIAFVLMPKKLRVTLDGVSDSVVAHVAAGSAMARRINASFLTYAKSRQMV